MTRSEKSARAVCWFETCARSLAVAVLFASVLAPTSLPAAETEGAAHPSAPAAPTEGATAGSMVGSHQPARAPASAAAQEVEPTSRRLAGLVAMVLFAVLFLSGAGLVGVRWKRDQSLPLILIVLVVLFGIVAAALAPGVLRTSQAAAGSDDALVETTSQPGAFA